MTNRPLRIAFMGTPDFAAAALQALIDSSHEVVCVYSQPPRPKGRGHKVQNSPVHDLAESNTIPVFTPKSLKGTQEQEQFAAQNVDVAIVAAYGLLLPKAVLVAPKYGCLNIHASLLPHWRGASPIQRAIWEGDAKTGVTLMQMDEGLDTGGMIAKTEIGITPDMTTPQLHDALAATGAGLLLDVLAKLVADGEILSQPQDSSQATYAHLLKKEDGRVDWAQDAKKIHRQIRALNPWPGVYTGEGDARVKITEAAMPQVETQEKAGTVLTRDGNIACGSGSVLQILKIQPAGKQAMDFASAVNGGYVQVGDIFS